MAQARVRRPPRSDWPPRFSAEYVRRMEARFDRLSRILYPARWVDAFGPTERFRDPAVAADWEARVAAALASPEGPEALANARILEWAARTGRPPYQPPYLTRDTPEGQAELRTHDDGGRLLDWAKGPPDEQRGRPRYG